MLEHRAGERVFNGDHRGVGLAARKPLKDFGREPAGLQTCVLGNKQHRCFMTERTSLALDRYPQTPNFPPRTKMTYHATQGHKDVIYMACLQIRVC